MLSAIYAECHYAKCHYAECRFAECRGAVAGQLLLYTVSAVVVTLTLTDNT
jgi:hypothetical protein